MNSNKTTISEKVVISLTQKVFCWISYEKHLLVNGWSYFEYGTQLLTFRKDPQLYLCICHIILQIRSKSRKVAGGAKDVKNPQESLKKHFEFGLGTPRPSETSAVLSCGGEEMRE